MEFELWVRMVTHISTSPEQTAALGEALGRRAAAGLVVGLVGDLGSGKTQFIKGVARGLECKMRVHSPTFALINEYGDGRLPCYHLDLYRLDSAEQVVQAGLEPYILQNDGVSLIEWFDRWSGTGGRVTGETMLITFRTIDEHSREITYEGAGV